MDLQSHYEIYEMREEYDSSRGRNTPSGTA